MVLYICLLNALDGIIKASLLYHKRFVKDLKPIGFVLNIYNSCVANNILQDKQLTVFWHVDDLKYSHIYPALVTKMGYLLKKTYERVFNDVYCLMKIAHGKIYEYLNMTLDFSTDGEVMVAIIP